MLPFRRRRAIQNIEVDQLVTFSARTGDPKRKIRGEMPSTPPAFLGLKWSKTLRIYEVLNGEQLNSLEKRRLLIALILGRSVYSVSDLCSN